jgi:hypothetical protein
MGFMSDIGWGIRHPLKATCNNAKSLAWGVTHPVKAVKRNVYNITHIGHHHHKEDQAIEVQNENVEETIEEEIQEAEVCDENTQKTSEKKPMDFPKSKAEGSSKPAAEAAHSSFDKVYDDFSFLNPNGTKREPNISKEEDSMTYSSDNPAPEKKVKPTTGVDETLQVEIPPIEDNTTSAATVHNVKPKFDDCVTQSSTDGIDIRGEGVRIEKDEKYPFMTDLKQIASENGYGLEWSGYTDFIVGYLLMNGNATGKSFAIDISGSIYNKILKIFMVKEGAQIEETNGFPIYKMDQNYKKVLNKKVISDLFKGGEEAVDAKEACYKGMDKKMNSFVDMSTINKLSINRNDIKTIRNRIFKALKAGAFDDVPEETRFRIAPESIQTREVEKGGVQVSFMLINDAPKYYGAPLIQPTRLVRMSFTFDKLVIE